MGGFSTLDVGLGGHSRFSLASTLPESSVTWDTTLELRDGDPALADSDNRFVWFSKRPIRLATLALGRSSGSGLLVVWMRIR